MYTEENGTDIAVWDETIGYIAKHGFNAVLIDVGDGIQYERHPEISAPDAWSKDFLKTKLDEIREICDKHGAVLIEDAAESLSATYKGRQTGTFGQYNAISVNGNKIIALTAACKKVQLTVKV